MRSCEYSRVENRGITKLLQVQDVTFFRSTLQQIHHSDLHKIEATFVTITFHQQKNDKKGESRTQQITSDSILCPVKTWKFIITSILSDPKLSDKATVNTVPLQKSESNHILLSQENTNVTLRSTCAMKEHNFFGYHHKDLGSHSLRSGAAMALFLAKEDVHRIMIIGRWSSDAFLAYIRPQIQEWTSGMSISMIQNDNFHNEPNPLTNRNNIQHPNDPLLHNNSSSFTSNLDKKPTSFNGSKSVKFTVPKLHMFH